MYKDVLKKYSKRELLMIRASTKAARDKTQQIIDRFEKNRPERVKSFKRKSGVIDLEKHLRFLNKSLDKLDECISKK